MILYILKSMACALFFIVMFHYLIEQDKILRFKRFYLLITLLSSFVIPLVSIPQISELFSPVAELTDIYIGAPEAERSPLLLSASDDVISPVIAQQPLQSTFTWMHGLIGVYILLTLLFLIRFLSNLVALMRMTKQAPIRRQGNIRIILEDRLDASFSFFNYIFINKNDYQNKNVKNKILIHEMTHVKQMHSADVLFVELLIIFFWFSPALYLYRRAMKLNHEFLADEEVIHSTEDIPFYQMLLIERAAHPCVCSLASSLTYLITKKRLIMMTKTTSKRSFLFKMSVLIPAFLLAGGIFSARTMAGDNVDMSVNKTVAESLFVTAEEQMIIPESGVSPETMDEYSAIVSKYLNSIVDGKVSWKSKIAREDELNLYPIYIQMTKEQRKKQLVGFSAVLDPLKLRHPNGDEWRGCTSSKNDQIWLDGKLIDSQIASTHHRKEIIFFIRRNDLKKSYMWTQKGYDAYVKKYGKQISLSDLLDIPAQYSVTTRYDHHKKSVSNGRFD